MGIFPKTPKRWADTRWLSLGIFLEDFFIHLPAYRKYYIFQKNIRILDILSKELNLALIAFLGIMTEEFCIYNKLYQKTNAHTYDLFFYMRKHFMDLFSITGHEDYLSLPFEDVKKIVFDGTKDYMKKDEELFSELKLKLKKVFDLTKLTPFDRKEFLKISKNYIDGCLKAMKIKLPLENKIVDQFKALKLDHFSKSNWIKLIEAFPNLVFDETEALSELNDLRELINEKNAFSIEKETKNEIKGTKGENHRDEKESEVLLMWRSFELNHGTRFPNILQIGTSILSFPISTAGVEREFKQLKLIKSEDRTSLKITTLESILITKDCLTHEMIQDRKFVNNVYGKYSNYISNEKDRLEGKKKVTQENKKRKQSSKDNEQFLTENEIDLMETQNPFGK